MAAMMPATAVHLISSELSPVQFSSVQLGRCEREKQPNENAFNYLVRQCRILRHKTDAIIAI